MLLGTACLLLLQSHFRVYFLSLAVVSTLTGCFFFLVLSAGDEERAAAEAQAQKEAKMAMEAAAAAAAAAAKEAKEAETARSSHSWMPTHC